MTILEELYHCNIRPAEKSICKNCEYRDLTQKHIEMIERIKSKISKEAWDMLQEAEETASLREAVIEQERYIDGFCTGAKLMLDILNYESKNFCDG